jgi:hypothetical protein
MVLSSALLEDKQHPHTDKVVVLSVSVNTAEVLEEGLTSLVDQNHAAHPL